MTALSLTKTRIYCHKSIKDQLLFNPLSNSRNLQK